jgi:hypothetical protein
MWKFHPFFLLEVKHGFARVQTNVVAYPICNLLKIMGV